MMGPVGFFLPQQGLKPVVGLGFQHWETINSVVALNGSLRAIDQHGVTRERA